MMPAPAETARATACNVVGSISTHQDTKANKLEQIL